MNPITKHKIVNFSKIIRADKHRNTSEEPSKLLLVKLIHTSMRKDNRSLKNPSNIDLNIRVQHANFAKPVLTFMTYQKIHAFLD